RDAHARQDSALPTAAASDSTRAEPGTGPRTDARAPERPTAARNDIVGAARGRGNCRAGRAAAQARIRRRSAGLCARAADAQAALLNRLTGARRNARARRDVA